MSSWQIPVEVERSALRKLDRAQHHLDGIHVALDKWVNGDSYSIVHQFDAHTQEHVARFTLHRAPPSGLDVIIGDFLQNLRNTLDHLVYGLTEIQLGTPLPDDVAENCFYPVADRFALTETKWQRTIGNLTPGAQAFIKGTQPDLTNQPRRAVLSVIDQLANLDKHRAVQVVTHGMLNADPIPRPIGGFGALQIGHVTTFVHAGGLDVPWRVTVGETIEVARYIVWDPETKQRVHMNVDARPCVTLDDGSPIGGLNLEPLLRWFYEYVTNWLLAPILLHFA